MKFWVVKNMMYFIGATLGAIVGYAYWYFIGCTTGTCAITSKPINSTIYFAFMGALVFSLFQKKEPQKSN